MDTSGYIIDPTYGQYYANSWATNPSPIVNAWANLPFTVCSVDTTLSSISVLIENAMCTKRNDRDEMLDLPDPGHNVNVIRSLLKIPMAW
jgi:hypothetical protein